MNRSFIDKLRNPDNDFLGYLRMLSLIVPLGIGFLIILTLFLSLLITKLAGAESVVTQALYWLLKPFLREGSRRASMH